MLFGGTDTPLTVYVAGREGGHQSAWRPRGGDCLNFGLRAPSLSYVQMVDERLRDGGAFAWSSVRAGRGPSVLKWPVSSCDVPEAERGRRNMYHWPMVVNPGYIFKFTAPGHKNVLWLISAGSVLRLAPDGRPRRNSERFHLPGNQTLAPRVCGVTENNLTCCWSCVISPSTR